MNRNLGIFLGSIGVLLLLLWAGIYWIGQPLASLAFAHAQRDEPLDALLLVDDLAIADTLQPLVAEQGGRIVGQYDMGFMPEGRRVDERAALVVVHVPEGRNLVRILTDSSYPGPAAATPEVLGIFSPPDRWPATFLLWLVKSTDRTTLEHTAGLQALVGSTELGANAPASWIGEVLSISREEHWNTAAVVPFADLKTATFWLTTDQGQLTRARLRARFLNPYAAVFTARPDPVASP